jgi:hypothetical protein
MNAPISPLETDDEHDVEAIALRLLGSAAMAAQRADSRARLLADPAAATPDGLRTLDAALDHLAFAAALGGANSDPARPRIAWTLAAGRTSPRGKVPGSKYLIDNPDTVYRFVTVDGVSSYEIDVKVAAPGPAQFHFMLHDTMFSEDTKKDLANLDQPIAGLRDFEIRTEADGSYRVTIDPHPADGRPNHIQSDGDARLVWIRNSLDHWGVQTPQAMQVRRVAGPPAPPPMSEAEMALQAAAILNGGTDWLLALMNRTFAHVAEPNTVSAVFGRGGAWGYAARANFRLDDDEALVISLEAPPPGSYLGFQLTDPWQVSLEYIRTSGSLNNHQATADPDGGYHFVVAPKDPGVANWLDTSSLHDGGLLIRWQALPDVPDALSLAIRHVGVVKRDALASVLPETSAQVTSTNRERLNEARARAYSHRHTGLK